MFFLNYLYSGNQCIIEYIQGALFCLRYLFPALRFFISESI